MLDHYKTLGISPAASDDEIRRAYRILARRYHPDVNPGANSVEKFRQISNAYDILSDLKKRNEYDNILEAFSNTEDRMKAAHAAYQRASVTREKESKVKRKTPEPAIPDSVVTRARKILTSLTKRFKRGKVGKAIREIAVLEVSIEIKEALFGAKKLISFSESGKEKRVSVPIHAGAFSGSIVRLRQKKRTDEELIVILRVKAHDYISITEKGVTLEVPITVEEALFGAKIEVTTPFGNIATSVPEATQSGKVIKIAGKGVRLEKEARGDLYLRFLVHAPHEPRATGLKEVVGALSLYYTDPIREELARMVQEISK